MLDPDFASALSNNPEQVLHEEFGVALAPGLSVRVVEESPDEIVLVVPAPRAPEELIADGTPFAGTNVSARLLAAISAASRIDRRRKAPKS